MIPWAAAQGSIAGRMLMGMPKNSQRKGSQRSVSRSISSVRLAFVTSVMWRAPPVRR